MRRVGKAKRAHRYIRMFGHHGGHATLGAVKTPDVIETFDTAGSPIAYMDAPEFSKFVADDSALLSSAVKKIGKVG